MKNIIGWAVEYTTGSKVSECYVRETEAEADILLADMKANDMFPGAGAWRKVPVYR